MNIQHNNHKNDRNPLHAEESVLPLVSKPDGVTDDSAVDTEANAHDTSASAPVNLQKRSYELDAVRYGDWELNGRCIDF